MIVAMYLVAIIAANLLVAQFGPSVAVLNAFLFIGLDITARDTLHERWQHNGLIWKMTVLIAGGSVLSALLNWGAARIALASFLAFASAGIADALIYHLLRERVRLLKINGSNVVSSAVDSMVFPALAFGFPLLWSVMLGQFLAKVVGGFVWSLILNQGEWRQMRILSKHP